MLLGGSKPGSLLLNKKVGSTSHNYHVLIETRLEQPMLALLIFIFNIRYGTKQKTKPERMGPCPHNVLQQHPLL